MVRTVDVKLAIFGLKLNMFLDCPDFDKKTGLYDKLLYHQPMKGKLNLFDLDI